MKERPILFSGEMVRAILDGRKSQTRRVLGFQPAEILTPSNRTEKALKSVTRKWGDSRVWFALREPPPASDTNLIVPFRCKYGEVGDRLWVRETWAPCGERPDGWRSGDATAFHVVYRADAERALGAYGAVAWKPSIHMPRWASRITLEITGVRVERVQDISENDARAEGFTKRGVWWDVGADWQGDGIGFPDARNGFEVLWDSLNGKRGYGWERSPWVWVIEFKRVTP